MATATITFNEEPKVSPLTPTPQVICIADTNWIALVLGLLLIIAVGIIIHYYSQFKRCNDNLKKQIELNYISNITNSDDYTEIIQVILAGEILTGEQMEKMKDMLRKKITHPNLESVISVSDYRIMLYLLLFIENNRLTKMILDNIKYTVI